MAPIVAAMLNLEIRKIYFIQAFPQADTPEDVHMRMPAGWGYKDENGNTDYVINLKKNLYSTYEKLAQETCSRTYSKRIHAI